MYAKLLFELQPTLVDQRFLSTDVGSIYQAIPWQELVALVPPPPHAQSGLGCKPWLNVQGGIGLLLLKHYLQMSDAKLIERINTDWSLSRYIGMAYNLKQQKLLTTKIYRVGGAATSANI